MKSTEFTQDTRPHELACGLRPEARGGRLLGDDEPCRRAVTPHGVALPPVNPKGVRGAFDQIVDALHPQRSRLLVATMDGVLAGRLFLHRDPHPLVAHCAAWSPRAEAHQVPPRQGIGARADAARPCSSRAWA
ncbi:hypothetical protein JCM4814A_93600 [Streptomyces phaeofaciens JCM 4814]|uniref:Uncharacterized protein n=1 Tax=Streptomyces phaeofaciens TaxID=68254 RepID=A0A918M216_9ACTN|nr:hypothetical protein GCM10010226_89480 [Streptomyces phaeofaciens]